MTRGSWFALAFLLWGTGLSAQDTLQAKGGVRLGFVNDEDNEISNTTTLSAFFEKLYQLKKNRKGIVHIVHIGDSHIQADLFTHTVRQLLQKEFGNAGRGFIFPGRLARTNEPQNIFTSSDAHWEAKRIVFTELPLPIGAGASTIRTAQPDAKFKVRTVDSPTLNYAFNDISVFFKKDFSSFNLSVRDSTGAALAYVGPFTDEKYPNFSRVTLPYAAHQIEFQTLQPAPSQNQFILFGLNLSNSKPGVIYHAIGGNGAKFKHYLEAQFFFEQMPALNADLFIISLGTNEAMDYPNMDAQFGGQAESFIGRIRQNNPDALIVITTPADFYRKRTRRNPGVEWVHSRLVEVAERNKLACWDLYTAAGGKHSADRWKKNNLLQGDGIHCTRAGYELEGVMLYQALLKGYNEYVRYRYP
jgi:lysophospholipase L1-like esterase